MVLGGGAWRAGAEGGALMPVPELGFLQTLACAEVHHAMPAIPCTRYGHAPWWRGEAQHSMQRGGLAHCALRHLLPLRSPA